MFFALNFTLQEIWENNISHNIVPRTFAGIGVVADYGVADVHQLIPYYFGAGSFCYYLWWHHIAGIDLGVASGIALFGRPK